MIDGWPYNWLAKLSGFLLSVVSSSILILEMKYIWLCVATEMPGAERKSWSQTGADQGRTISPSCNEEVARQAHEAELRRLEVEKLCAEHPLDGAQKWVNDAVNNINAMEHNNNHAEHLVRESEARVNSIRCEIGQIEESIRNELSGIRGGIHTGMMRHHKNQELKKRHEGHINSLKNNLTHLQNDLPHKIAHRDHCHNQLHEAHQNKYRVETHS